MSDKFPRNHEPFRGYFEPRGEPLDLHPNDEPRHANRHPQPITHHPINSRPRRYDEHAPERSLIEPSSRLHYGRPPRNEPINGYAITGFTAAPNSTYRQQARSDPVRRSTEFNPRIPQILPHDNEFDGGHSSAHGTTRSSSSSRRARDASFHDLGEHQHLQSEDTLLTRIGDHTSQEAGIWLDAGPPCTTSISMSGSPPHQPSSRSDREDHDYVDRGGHDHRAGRSEVFEQDGRTERYERSDHLPLRDRFDDVGQGRLGPLPRGDQQRVSHEENQHLHREEQRRADRHERQRAERRAERRRRPDYDYE